MRRRPGDPPDRSDAAAGESLWRLAGTSALSGRTLEQSLELGGGAGGLVPAHLVLGHAAGVEGILRRDSWLRRAVMPPTGFEPVPPP
jgi:hypothetical protein